MHCCAEDTEVNSAREMFLRRVGLFEHLVADVEGHNLENERPFVYDQVPQPRVAGGGLRIVGSMGVCLCPHAEPREKVDEATKSMKRLDLFGEGMECKGLLD